MRRPRHLESKESDALFALFLEPPLRLALGIAFILGSRDDSSLGKSFG